jgi:DNA-binding PadR family transcriptional regulator
MSTVRLTPTSHVVLGLIEQLGTATSYELKRAAADGVGYFWSLPHTQLYSEPARLAAAGLLAERREPKGRRRRLYTLTAGGREALDTWRSEPTAELYEIHDAGLLQLFFGADPAALAESQLAAHRENLRMFEGIEAGSQSAEVPEGVRLALEAGIGHAREYVRFWSAVARKQSEEPPA